MGALERLHSEYGDRVAFFVVYIREAHPEDGWVLAENRRASVAVADPATPGERQEVARTCATRFAVDIPVLVDDVGDDVARRYGAWPDRLYLVGRDGRIAFQGGPGPFEFKPAELERAITRELGVRDEGR